MRKFSVSGDAMKLGNEVKTINCFQQRPRLGKRWYFVADIFLQRNITVVFAPMDPMRAFCTSGLVCPKTIARGRPRKVAIAMLTNNGSLCVA